MALKIETYSDFKYEEKPETAYQYAVIKAIIDINEQLLRAEEDAAVRIIAKTFTLFENADLIHFAGLARELWELQHYAFKDGMYYFNYHYTMADLEPISEFTFASYIQNEVEKTSR